MHTPPGAVPANHLIADIFPALDEELSHPGNLGASRVRFLVCSLLVETTRAFTGRDQSVQEATGAVRVRGFLASLPGRCEQPWSLDDMAAACGMGRSRFSTYAMDIAGESPVSYLNRLRIRKADDLLITTGQNITDIAFDCGFNSSQYFSRVYHAYRNESPRAYRARHTLQNT